MKIITAPPTIHLILLLPPMYFLNFRKWQNEIQTQECPLWKLVVHMYALHLISSRGPSNNDSKSDRPCASCCSTEWAVFIWPKVCFQTFSAWPWRKPLSLAPVRFASMEKQHVFKQRYKHTYKHAKMHINSQHKPTSLILTLVNMFSVIDQFS